MVVDLGVLKMHKVVELISFIIWITYYFLLVSREICRKNLNKDKYDINLIKTNIFYLFRLDSLFFLIIFYIYKGFNNESVTIYLYFVFVVSSLVFILYDINDKYNIKKNNYSKEKKYYIISFILMFIPIIYYFITKNVANACFYTLLINFLLPVGIYISHLVLKDKKV